MARRRLRVGVTGFGGLDNPEPGTAVARALRLGIPEGLVIEALVYEPWSPGAFSPGLVDGIHLLPVLAEGDEALLARVLDVRRARGLDVLVPSLDLDVLAFARLAPRLARAGVRTLLPSPERVAATAKIQLPYLCHFHAIPAPRTVFVPSLVDVPYHADQFGYPLMVKGTVSGAARAANREEAMAAAANLARTTFGAGTLLQEVIEGDEYTVAAVVRERGTCLGMVPIRKVGVNRRGKAVVGAVVDDPDVEHEAARILERLQWRGPLELEFIHSRKDEQLYLTEINPRFPNWILLSHWAGTNLPALLVREILEPGRRGTRRPRAGTMYARSVEEVTIDGDAIDALGRLRQLGSVPRPRAPASSPAAGRRPRRLRVAVTGISAFDDVMPGLGVARALRSAPEVEAVHGLVAGPYDTGAYRHDLVDGVWSLPVGLDGAALLARLREIRKAAGIEVVIPCTDVDVARFVAIRSELPALGLRALLPATEALARFDKRRLLTAPGRLPSAGFDVPPTRVVRTLDALERAVRELGCPLVVKGGLTQPEIAATPALAASAWHRVRAQGLDEVLVQRFVAGEEFAVSLVVDAAHRVIASIAVKKLRQCERGKTWGARAVELPGLVASLETLLETFRWVGPMEAEFIRDAWTERFALLELNPRFPAWIGFAADIGVNLPREVVRAALGSDPSASLAREVAELTAMDGARVYVRNCREFPVEPAEFARLAAGMERA